MLKQIAPYLFALVGLWAGLLLHDWVNPAAEPLTERQFKARVDTLLEEATPRPPFSNLVYQIIQPSLVVIHVEAADPLERDMIQARLPVASENVQDDPAPDEPPETDPDATTTGVGAGVVVSEQGAILTALHVVVHGETINILFADGTRTTAEIVAADPDNDIAVLQPARLPELFAPATLGSVAALGIGDEAYVVGNPVGLTGSLSAGVISGFERTLPGEHGRRPLSGLIQFDAAVNPGASGGPLLNRAGQVVGIVVGLVNPADHESFAGIGFATPITTAGAAAGAPNQ